MAEVICSAASQCDLKNAKVKCVHLQPHTEIKSCQNDLICQHAKQSHVHCIEKEMNG